MNKNIYELDYLTRQVYLDAEVADEINLCTPATVAYFPHLSDDEIAEIHDDDDFYDLDIDLIISKEEFENLSDEEICDMIYKEYT